MKNILFAFSILLSGCAFVEQPVTEQSTIKYNREHPYCQIGYPKVYGKYLYIDTHPTKEQYAAGYRYWGVEEYKSRMSSQEKAAQLELDIESAKFDVLSAEGDILQAQSHQ
jgi:hypothetical protein